jgi:ribosomal protein S18 acetylase RimI-like enzyme
LIDVHPNGTAKPDKFRRWRERKGPGGSGIGAQAGIGRARSEAQGEGTQGDRDMEISVRRLAEEDAEIFREIRLEALDRHPEAFQATYERSAELPLEAFAARLKRYLLFGGFLDGRLMGFVGFYPLQNPMIKHKGVLWGMYVREEARGTGLAQAMVETVLEYAGEHVEQVVLSVMASNERARRFYEKMGFERYGLEKNALRIGDRYFDEEFRVHFLK